MGSGLLIKTVRFVKKEKIECQSAGAKVNEKRKWKKSDTIGWLVMLPTLVLFTFFVWEPLLENIRISLYSAKGYELLEFVGLKIT